MRLSGHQYQARQRQLAEFICLHSTAPHRDFRALARLARRQGLYAPTTNHGEIELALMRICRRSHLNKQNLGIEECH